MVPAPPPRDDDQANRLRPDESPPPHWFEGVYDSLVAFARRKRRSFGDSFTLRTHGIVHDAFLKAGEQREKVRDPEALGRSVIWSVIHSYNKRRKAAKRSKDQTSSLDDPALDGFEPAAPPDSLLTNECVEKLRAVAPRQAEVFELREFSRFEEAEVAERLRISTATVGRDLKAAKIYLGACVGNPTGDR